MADFSFEAQPRQVTGKKVKALRREGFVPFTVYGPKVQPMSLQVPYRTIELALMKAGGTNLIDIKVEGGETYTVLARDVQRHVIKGFIEHVDFFAVDKDAVIRTEVPINFTGHAPAVDEAGAVLMTGTSFLTVEVLPGDLIHEVEVDLTTLKDINDSIYVRDLVLGDKINIINDPDEMLASVQISSAARSLEDAEALEDGDVDMGAEPEVIARGKEEEEE